MLVAQLTDPHGGQRIDLDGRVIDTLACLDDAVAHMNAMSPAPDLVLITGDLVASELA